MGRLANAALGICLDYYPWKRDVVPAKDQDAETGGLKT